MKKIYLTLFFISFIYNNVFGIEFQQITVSSLNSTDINIHTKVLDGYYFEYNNHNFVINNNTITLNICFAPFLTPVVTIKENDFVIPNVNNGSSYILIVNINKRMYVNSSWVCDNVIDKDTGTLQFSTPLSAAVTLGSNDFSDLDSKILIYPNPTSGKVYLSTKQAINQITIYDEIGRSLKVISNISNNEIDLTGLDNGIYYLEIKTNLGQCIKKVIIDK